MIIYGINPVIEALRGGRVVWLRVSDRGGTRMREILRLASDRGIPVRHADVGALSSIARGGAHQGVVAELAAAPAPSIGDLLREAADPPLFLVLDGIEDPQNLGAIIRAANGAGVDGVVRQARRSAPMAGAAAKASAGALAHTRVATVVNLTRAITELRAAGVWIVGLTAEAPQSYATLDLTLPTALVIGGEGRGLRRLVKENCDWLASIPMAGEVASLNVAVAAGVALYEAVRQRRHPEPTVGGTAPDRPRRGRSRPGPGEVAPIPPESDTADTE